MSLSETCSQQHQQEQQQLRKILLWGLLGSVGVHGIALSLSQLSLWQRNAADELVPIELIVTEPSPEVPEALPAPAAPAELSTQTNDSAPAASASPRPAAVAPPPPEPTAPPVEQVTADVPEPIEDTQTESDFEEPAEPEPEAQDDPSEVAEVAEDAPSEDSEPEDVAAEANESQSDRLRDLFQRLRESQAEGEAESATAAATGSATTESATAGDGNVPNAPAGDDSGVATAPSSGTGQGQGSRTVACQDCVRPSYPRSALDAGAEGQPMVSVDINPDGSVRSVTLTRSSGNPAIDQAAIEAARRSRFQPVAGGASVPIEYDLTIEGSRRNRDAQQRGERRAVDLPTPPPAADAAPTATTPSPDSEAAPEATPEAVLEDTPPAEAPETTPTPAAEPAPPAASPEPADEPEPEPAPEPEPESAPEPAPATPPPAPAAPPPAPAAPATPPPAEPPAPSADP